MDWCSHGSRSSDFHDKNSEDDRMVQSMDSSVNSLLPNLREESYHVLCATKQLQDRTWLPQQRTLTRAECFVRHKLLHVLPHIQTATSTKRTLTSQTCKSL